MKEKAKNNKRKTKNSTPYNRFYNDYVIKICPRQLL